MGSALEYHSSYFTLSKTEESREIATPVFDPSWEERSSRNSFDVS